MSKLFSFAIKLNASLGGFFVFSTPPGYLCQLRTVDDDVACVIPCFGEDPVQYPLGSALFLVRELRRAGYNVCSVPYVIILVKRRLAACLAARRRW